MTCGSFWSGGFSFFIALWKKMWISLFSLAVVRSLLSKFWAFSSIFFLENVNATAGSLSFFLSMSITDIQIFLSWNVDIKHSRAWIHLDLNTCMNINYTLSIMFMNEANKWMLSFSFIILVYQLSWRMHWSHLLYFLLLIITLFGWPPLVPLGPNPCEDLLFSFFASSALLYL